MAKKTLSERDRTALISGLKERFEKYTQRHKGIKWEGVEARLRSSPDKLWSLAEMERTGGEPDVVSWNKKSDEYTFYDCSPESPNGRRSVCFDREALESRKENKPKDSALGMASDLGVEILTEEEYRELQKLGEFDLKTSSWVGTPADIRALGGALFCDRRYGKIFTYHNGAESYYGARGFRASIKL